MDAYDDMQPKMQRLENTITQLRREVLIAKAAEDGVKSALVEGGAQRLLGMIEEERDRLRNSLESTQAERDELLAALLAIRPYIPDGSNTADPEAIMVGESVQDTIQKYR